MKLKKFNLIDDENKIPLLGGIANDIEEPSLVNIDDNGYKNVKTINFDISIYKLYPNH